jgi:hypothetical protein
VADALFRDLYDGLARFRSIELCATVSHDGAALARASVRAAKARALDPRSFRVFSMGRDSLTQYGWHVWWTLPGLWRDEITWPNDLTDVAVIRGDSALVYVASEQTLYTNDLTVNDPRWTVLEPPRGIVELPTIEKRLGMIALFRPPFQRSDWSFTTESTEQVYLGRTVRHVRAKRRSTGSNSPPNEGFDSSFGVDEYECIVDDEFRILLRLVGIIDGRPAMTITADSVGVNHDIGDEVFSFTPRRALRIAHVTSWPAAAVVQSQRREPTR